MKRFFCWTTFLCFSALYAQSGAIQGTVIDSKGIPISGAVISIESIKKQTSSDAQGKFFFLDLEENTYTVRVAYLGYNTVERAVNLNRGSVTNQVFVLAPTSILLEDVVLNVYRNDRQLRALNTQRNTTTIINTISIDETSKFPDANIGDALKRISGITMQVKEGEAQDIIIRGLAPELNSVTINGSRLPSTNGDDRSIQLDVIPTDMIESIEVTKSLTPDMEADALGGSVNLITRAAPQGFRISTTLGSGINLLSDKRVWNANFLIGNRSKNSKFGWMLSATVNDNDYASHNIEAEWTNIFEYNTGDLDADNEPILEEIATQPYTNTLLQQTFFLQRIRRSLAANMEYVPNKNHTLFLKTFLNWRDDRENRFVFENETVDPEDISESDFSFIGDNLVGFPSEISRQTIGGIDDNRSKNARLEVKRLQSFSTGGTHVFKNLKIDWQASFADASEEATERLAEYKSEYGVFNETSDEKFPFLNPVDAGEANDLENFEFTEIVEELLFNKEEDINFLTNVEMPSKVVGFKNGTLKFGLKNRFKYKARNNDFTFFDFEDDFPTMAAIPTTDYSDPDFLVGSQYQAGLFPDKRWLANLNLSNGETLADEFLRQHYSIKENVFAGYGLLNEKISDKLTLITGIRFEHTNVKAKANTIQNPEEFDRITNKKSYTNVLPGIHAKYKLSERSILKFGWSNTLARPNYVDLVPTLEIVREDEEIILGNPNLDPTTSMNFDLLAEHYFKSIGVISGGAFFKNLKSFIYIFKSEATDDSFGAGTEG
nr:TonB-dependent receptor [Flavobacteriaceae bacterium]